MGRWEREESDLNAVGPKIANSVQTGQTGPGQTDREIAILWFPYLGPKLMTLISSTAVN